MSILSRIQRRAEKSIIWMRGWFFAYIVLPIHKLLHIPIQNLNAFERTIPFIERKEYAQNREDGIINAIFGMIGTTNKFYVEFGVEDGKECNTRYLMKHRGWHGLLLDGSNENAEINLQKEFITAENIETLFKKYNVPKTLDVLSIDIDGNDYWVWKAIQHYEPRVVIIEYNAHIKPPERKTIPYDPTFVWDKTNYMGASFGALVALGKEKGYTPVATDSCGVNAFFVRNDLISGAFAVPHWEELWHPTAYKGKPGLGHPPDPHNRPWQTV